MPSSIQPPRWFWVFFLLFFSLLVTQGRQLNKSQLALERPSYPPTLLNNHPLVLPLVLPRKHSGRNIHLDYFTLLFLLTKYYKNIYYYHPIIYLFVCFIIISVMTIYICTYRCMYACYALIYYYYYYLIFFLFLFFLVLTCTCTSFAPFLVSIHSPPASLTQSYPSNTLSLSL